MNVVKQVRNVTLCAALLCTLLLSACSAGENTANENAAGGVDGLVSEMTLEEKISQMIIPAIRTWDDVEVTDIDEFPKLKEALRKHQYGGIILFGQNIVDTEQTVRLVSDLQKNNLEIEDASAHIPYLMPLDEEGGIVIRLTNGTRMTGNMAIGATGESAEENANLTGQIIGEELAALGFNADFAPDVDVNNNAANPVIGVRSFSDDPEIVAALGKSYMDGLADSNIAATCKHFPGHGDTSVDSHIGTPTVDKTYDELRQTELVPFQAMAENGVDMVMTAHITFPEIDDEVTFADGTKGYYPATMSKKIVSDILRGDFGYDGVVVTDAMEMGALMETPLVEGEPGTAEYMANLSEKVINAGVDILLIPADLKNEEAIAFYDGYISALEEKVEDGTIPAERIDESVERILELKEKHGIVESGFADMDVEKTIENAEGIVGSEEHHQKEMEIAGGAVTLLKNEGNTLPLSKDTERIVLLGRQETDRALVESTMRQLQAEGEINLDADISFEYYAEFDDAANEKLHYTEDMAESIRGADVVIGMTQTSSASMLAEDSPSCQAIQRAIDDVHQGGGRFVLLSCRLPYDAARFQEADAIALAYLGVGLDADPTAGSGDTTGVGAYNANVVAALNAIAGKNEWSGQLPVNIPEIQENEDGTISYGDEILYERGYHMMTTDIEGCDTFAQIVDKLEVGKAYANVTFDGTDVLLVASMAYDDLEGHNAAVDAEVFCYDNGKPIYAGFVESGGTANPLVLKDGKLYSAGHHFVEKSTIADGKLMTERAEENFDSEGNATTYFYESDDGDDYSNLDQGEVEKIYQGLYEEYLDAEIINFDTVQK